ncbi:MAG: FkbM family methyltransferase, partial [Thaumarchaeota archaeon]|nr:FkbM family methyltransferase [Nitrososphaerota archaeon]
KLLGDVRGKIVIDVGASMGDTPIYFAKKGAKEVYAFEPDKEEFDLAVKNITLNQITNIRLYNKGLGLGQDSLSHLLEQLPVPAVVKMDCEGCEFETIDSLSDLSLKKLERIVIEYHGNPERIENKLAGSGFKVKVHQAWTYLDKTPVGYLTAERN